MSDILDNTPKNTENNLVNALPPQKEVEQITIDEFFKVKLIVGQILHAEQLSNSQKLLKLKVDLGPNLAQKQILSGIAKFYSPESLIGRKIVVVANLKPAKLAGELSEGMLLAGEDAEGRVELVSPHPNLSAGSIIR